jgi:hypothetical protein
LSQLRPEQSSFEGYAVGYYGAALALRPGTIAVHGDGPRRLMDVESQSEPHPDMLERVGEYAYRLRRGVRCGNASARKYRVLSVLLNLTGPAQAQELDMREADLDDAGLHLRVVQITFTDEDAGAILARIASGELSRGVLPWIPLMRDGGEAGIIGEWRRLALQEPDEQRRGDYGGLALVFAELAGRKPAWMHPLKGWNMKESQTVLEWQREARVEELQGVILRAIELRFRTRVPADVAATISASNDLEELSRWFEATQPRDSLDAFRAAVGQRSISSRRSIREWFAN